MAIDPKKVPPKSEPLSFGLPAAEVNPAGMGAGQFIVESMKVAAADVVEAELMPPDYLKTVNFRTQQAMAFGALKAYTSSLNRSDPLSVKKLEVLNGAIRSGDIAAIGRVHPVLGEVFSIYADKPAELNSFNKDHAYPFLQGQKDILEGEGAIAKAESDAALKKSALQLAYDTDKAVAGMPSVMLGLSPAARPSFIAGTLTEIDALKSLAIGLTDDVQIKALQDKASKLETGLVNAAVISLAQGLSGDQLDVLSSAVLQRNKGMLDPELHSAYDALTPIIESSSSALDAFETIFGQFAKDVGAGNTKVLEAKALTTLKGGVTSMLPMLGTAPDISSVTSMHKILDANLKGIENLPEVDAKNAHADLNQYATNAALGIAMAMATTPEQVDDIEAYAANPNAKPSPRLTPKMVEAIDQARVYANETGDTGFIGTRSGRLATDRRRQLSNDAAQAAADQRRYNISIGLGDPNASEDQLAANGYALSLLNDQLREAGAPPVASLPVDFFYNPANATSPIAQAVLKSVSSTNVLPKQLVDTLTSIANGNVTVSEKFDYRFSLAVYENARTTEDARGVIKNPAITALSPDAIARLDFLSELNRIESDPVRIEAIYSQAITTQGDPAFADKVSSFLGQTTQEFIKESIGEDRYMMLDTAQRAAFEGIVNFEIGAHYGSPGRRTSKSALADRLDDQIDNWVTDGGGIVVQYGSDSVPTRMTAFPLSKATGPNEEEAKEYILQDVAKFAKEYAGLGFYYDTSIEPAKVGWMASFMPAPGSVITPDRERYIELVAAGKNEVNGYVYYIQMVDPKNGLRKLIQRDDGKGPLIFATKEAGFSTIVEAKAASKHLADTEAAKARRDFLVVMQDQLVVSP